MKAGKRQTQTGGRPATTGHIPGMYSLAVGMPPNSGPNGWRWTLLTNLARLESGHTPSRKHPEYWGGDIPWIGIRDATGNHGRTLQDTEQHTNELGIDNSSARVLPKNTVCLSRTASVGYVVVMGRPMATSQDFVNWVCSDQLDYRFLKYILLSEKRSLLQFASGTTHQTIYFPEVKGFHICHPDITTQRKIAGVLSAYDDLIENNTRRIAILEEMAQAIYREWFVNFRFPGHEKVKLINSPLGTIPEGWKPLRLGDMANEVRRGVDPSQVDPDTPYIGLEHLPRRSITLGEWGKAADVQSTKLAFRKGEILFGKIRPYFHKVGVAPVDGVCSSDAIVIVPTSASAFGPVLCCVSSDDFVRHATQTSQGTKMPRANWDVLVKYPLPLPPDGLLHNFNEIISDTAATLRLLMLKNRNLRATRDLLLPKLISGQLDVEEFDIETGEPLVEAEA